MQVYQANWYSVKFIFIFRKNVKTGSSSVIRQKGESQTGKCAYQGVRNVRFLVNLACFVFLKHRFWDSPFWLITDGFIQLLWQIMDLRVLKSVGAILRFKKKLSWEINWTDTAIHQIIFWNKKLQAKSHFKDKSFSLLAECFIEKTSFQLKWTPLQHLTLRFWKNFTHFKLIPILVRNSSLEFGHFI